MIFIPGGEEGQFIIVPVPEGYDGHTVSYSDPALNQTIAIVIAVAAFWLIRNKFRRWRKRG